MKWLFTFNLNNYHFKKQTKQTNKQIVMSLALTKINTDYSNL